MIIIIPLLLLILVIVSYFIPGVTFNLLWVYLVIALGATGLLIFLFFLGMLDLGGDGDVHSVADHHSVHHDTSGADHGGGLPLFVTSPSAVLILSALFGGFGLISHSILFFLPSRVKDLVSIFVSTFLSLFIYAYVVKVVLSFLKTSSIVKSGSYYEGKEAEVLYDIPEDGFGKVNVKTEDKIEQLLAKSEDGSRIPAGQIVRIKKHMGTFVIVEKI
ncbi:MAG: NfeD family protein [bacterium]